MTTQTSQQEEALELNDATTNDDGQQLNLSTLPTDDPAPPDGGYGWVVIFGCAVVAFWFTGISYSWGVIQKALVDEGVASASTLSYVGGLTPMCIALFAILNARLVRSIGAKWMGIAGVILVGLGNILAGSATSSLAGLFVCVGIISGIGTSFSFMAVSTTPTQYFSRRRGFANGIVYGAGGLGGAVISILEEELVEKFNVAWTLRIVGMLAIVTGVPAAWLIKERAPARRRVFIDWELFKDAKFTLLFTAGAISTFTLFVVPFFLPLYSSSIGLSAAGGAAMVAGFNLSSALGRIGFGSVSDIIGPLNALLISLLLSSVSLLAIWPVSKELGPLILFVITNGAANGGFFSTMPTVVGSIFGSSKVAVAMGMVVTGWAAGYLLGAPSAGYILAAFGGQEAGLQAYRPAMYYAGSLSVAAAILLVLLRIQVDKRFKIKV